MFALCGFSWDSAIAKRRVEQCAVLSGGHLGVAARLPVYPKKIQYEFKELPVFLKFTKEKSFLYNHLGFSYC